MSVASSGTAPPPSYSTTTFPEEGTFDVEAAIGNAEAQMASGTPLRPCRSIEVMFNTDCSFCRPHSSTSNTNLLERPSAPDFTTTGLNSFDNAIAPPPTKKARLTARQQKAIRLLFFTLTIIGSLAFLYVAIYVIRYANLDWTCDCLDDWITGKYILTLCACITTGVCSGLVFQTEKVVTRKWRAGFVLLGVAVLMDAATFGLIEAMYHDMVTQDCKEMLCAAKV